MLPLFDIDASLETILKNEEVLMKKWESLKIALLGFDKEEFYFLHRTFLVDYNFIHISTPITNSEVK